MGIRAKTAVKIAAGAAVIVVAASAAAILVLAAKLARELDELDDRSRLLWPVPDAGATD